MQRSDYDLRGNRTVEYHEQTAGVPSYLGVDRVLSYDANRRQLGSRRYFGDGARYTYTSRPGELYEEYDSYDLGGWLSQAENFAYDADGRLIFQDSWTRKDDYATWVRSAAQDNANGRQSTDAGVLDRRQNRVEYLDANGQSTYDRTGKATGFRQFGDGYVHTFATTYEGWESYQEKRVTGSSSNNNYKATTNTLEYDPYGRLKWQVENTPLKNGSIDDRIRYYAYNGDGQVQTRREGTIQNGQFTQADAVKPNYLYVYAGGQQMAQLREGPKGIQSLSGMGMYDAGGARVTAMPGESLRQLAQRVYGNDQLWYVLAQANGLGDPDQEIGGGLQLDAPKVDVSRNDANTFKPYNPAEAMGPTTPSLPYVPPPPSAGCNTLALVIMVVIAVVVSIATYGAATGYFAAALGQTGAAIAGGAIAGAAGSIASQTFGSIAGVTSFSWKNVAVSAAAGAIGGGFTQMAKAGTFGEVLKSSAHLRAATGAALGNVVSYGANKAVGNEASFSWTSVAISAAAAGAGSWLGDQAIAGFNIDGEFSESLTRGFAGGLVSGHLSRAVYGNDINYTQVAVDAFGTAIANAMTSTSAPPVPRSQAGHIAEGTAANYRIGRNTQPLMDEFAPGIRTLDPIKVYDNPDRTWREFSQWQWYQDANRYVTANRREQSAPMTGMSSARMGEWHQREKFWHDGMSARAIQAQRASERPHGAASASPEKSTLAKIASYSGPYQTVKMIEGMLGEAALGLGFGEQIKNEFGEVQHTIRPFTGELATRKEVKDARLMLFVDIFSGGSVSRPPPTPWSTTPTAASSGRSKTPPLKNGSIDDRVRYYAYNGDGQIQTRREGTIQDGQFTQADAVKPNHLYVYAGGQQMAQLREGPKSIRMPERQPVNELSSTTSSASMARQVI